ncbi:hypothetical protein KP22_14215 [Pectobacterium betavasculorum]|uniref:Uncharacterized protein n=1 Tax=Pectobacterium betavasculorum TaxID=55207 RepID=A0A093RMK7_9GAMM|nr:hypothetical protein [Pectobacterium betavasculorum]KFX04005.1 hypothetical protein KP22_14215 [Pectobacterium betavasculorum]
MTYLKSYDFEDGSIYESICDYPYISNVNLVKCKNKLVKDLFWDGAIYIIGKYISCFFDDVIKGYWCRDKIIFKLAISAHEYKGVYFFSRDEASYYLPDVIKYRKEINEVYSWLSEKNMLNMIFNLCINHFVFNWGDCESKGQMIAPYQFQMGKNQKLYYRDDCFYVNHNIIMSMGNTPIYDLHDFAHVVSTLCKPSLYGCYYHDLPENVTNNNFRKLISMYESSGCDSISDGFLYSKVTRKIYDDLEKTNDYNRIVDVIGERIANYLMGKSAIVIDDKKYKRNTEISFEELIILVINKLYESSASEVERFVLIRNDGSIDLSLFTPAERLIDLEANSQWLYAEARNTLRHRGHCEAYRKTLSMLSVSHRVNSALYDTVCGILDFNINDLRLGIAILKNTSQLKGYCHALS